MYTQISSSSKNTVMVRKKKNLDLPQSHDVSCRHRLRNYIFLKLGIFIVTQILYMFTFKVTSCTLKFFSTVQ